MSNTLLMAVDLGTSFIKVGVYNEAGEFITEAIESVKDYRPGPGIFIQKGEELYESVVACMKKTVQKLGDRSGDVAAVAFTGQMAGFMGVDKDWNDITTWSCSLDSRYMPYANRQMETLKDHFLRVGGTNFPQMAPKYEWFKTEFPDEAKKISKYLMISGYVIGRLGELDIEDAVMDRTYSAWTGLCDVNADDWSDKTCDAIGLDKKFLPRVVTSNTVCGKLSASAAKITGLKQGIALVSGAGDKAAGCLGSAAVEPGDGVFEASSYGQISCCVPEYRADSEYGRFDAMASPVPGEFYTVHFAAGSGITIDWYVNTFVRKEGEDLGAVFRDLDSKIADLTPGCNGLMSIGLLSGSSMPSDGILRGMWMGFDWSHGTEHFYRALLESFTYDLALAIQSKDRIYPEYKGTPVRIIGGGAKNPVWSQMSADVAARPYFTINRSDCAMWGAAVLAGNGIGLFGDLKETVKKHITKEKEYTPNMEMHETYKKYVKLYSDYLVELRDFYGRIQELASKA
ncbi:MAG: FGGY family carbohydrate kinase [Oscillospiraceae bacterium]|nr:FGGY family carbohydrate kinase [Oscillospiraceae bacterium]MCL2277788.1 FGGY family carbohydrate kinase [Oscillospiraceae bacterium]